MSKPRRCKGCGVAERSPLPGYTSIAPHLGYCVECINRAFDLADREAGIKADTSPEQKILLRAAYDDMRRAAMKRRRA